MKAVFKHDVSLYYHSLLAYVFGAFLLEFIGIGAMLYNINRAVANFEYALGTFCIAFVGLVPVLTMRVMAEEKSRKPTSCCRCCPSHPPVLCWASILRQLSSLLPRCWLPASTPTFSRCTAMSTCPPPTVRW